MSNTINYEAGTFQIRFSYDTAILAAVRVLPQRQWHAEEKYWSATDTPANRPALVALAERFNFELTPAATAVLPASENAEVIEMVVANSRQVKNLPEQGYLVRGGGSMFDGAQWYEAHNRGGVLAYRECPQDRSGLSGSGRSGYVEYELPERGTHLFRVIETSGSIKRQSDDDSFLLLTAGEWYWIDEDAICAILGCQPAANDDDEIGQDYEY